MFLSFYGLREQPFGVTPDPRFLYLSRTHREVLASLIYGIESDRGFLGLIAGPGMGKTTLLYQVLSRFRTRARTAFVFQTQCGSRELIRHILGDFGVDTHQFRDDPVLIHRKFNELISREARAGNKCLIVIDEAQDLDESALETIRLLSNFETSRSKLLQIVIAGQSPLAGRLAKPSMVQLLQRISSLNRLVPLNSVEVGEYIDYRLHVAGRTGPPLFTPAALEIIAGKSGGIPRRINNLCFNSLSLGFANQQKRLDADIVCEVASDLTLAEVESEPLEEVRHKELQRLERVKVIAMQGQTMARVVGRTEIDAASIAGAKASAPAEHLGSPGSFHTRTSPASEQSAPAATGSTRVETKSPIPIFSRRSKSPFLQPHNLRNSRTPISNGLLHGPVRLAARAPEAMETEPGSIFKSRAGRIAVALVVGALVIFMFVPIDLLPGKLVHRGEGQIARPELQNSTQPDGGEQNIAEATASSDNGKASGVEGDDARTQGNAGSTLTSTPSQDGNAGNIQAASTGQNVTSSLSIASVRLLSFVPNAEPSGDGALSAKVRKIGIQPQGPSEPPRLLHRVEPSYSAAIRVQRIAGTVVLTALIDRQGDVKQVTVVQGDQRLVGGIVAAVKQWKYKPSYSNGMPVDARATLSISIKPSE